MYKKRKDILYKMTIAFLIWLWYDIGVLRDRKQQRDKKEKEIKK